MDERDMRDLLRGYLEGTEWSRGRSKRDILDRLDDDALRVMVDQYVAEGVYFSADDVLSVIPEQAWQAAQGDDWRGGAPAEETESFSRFLESPVAQPSNRASALTNRVKQTAAQTRDQVLSITTRNDAPAADGRKRPAVPVLLSAAMEGLGQAYNRQPVKALGFVAAGLTLSTASGLNTWLVRNVFRVRHARLGPAEVKPALLGLWAATFALNLVDAWRGARSSVADNPGSTATAPSAWTDLQPARPDPPVPSAGTDEYPAVTAT